MEILGVKCQNWRYKAEFKTILSYNRFIALKSRVLCYLVLLLEWYCHQAQATGISYIDSTSLAVCHPKRISRNKVFRGIAALGKTEHTRHRSVWNAFVHILSALAAYCLKPTKPSIKNSFLIQS